MFADFLETCKSRYGSGHNVPLGEWVCLNTTLRRKPFSFDKYPFQRQIIDDLHPNMVVEKCSQIGLTEVQLRKFLAMLVRHPGRSGIFTLPNDDMFKRVYASRIKPLLDADPIFNPPSEVKPIRNTGLIQIRDSFGFITGCKEGDATSISADFLFNDEVDLSPPDILSLFPSRVQGSDMGIIQGFSTPSFKGRGINQQLVLSDQHEYFVRCDSCRKRQIPLFDPTFVPIPGHDVEKFIDLTPEEILSLPLDDLLVRCEHCGAPLDLGRSDNREWVAKYPGRVNARGYKVRPFSTGQLKPYYMFRRLAKAMVEQKLRGYFNTVEGEPYTGSDSQIQREDVLSVMAHNPTPPPPSPGRPYYLGADLGITCHVVLTTPSTTSLNYDYVYFTTCHSSQLEATIRDLMRSYNIVQGCVDRFPYTPTADALRDNTHGVIMPVQYRGTAPVSVGKDEAEMVTHYSANRTHALDRVQTGVLQKTTVIAGYGHHKETIIEHLGDMVRDDRDEAEPVWTKSAVGNDHFMHAMALAQLAPRINEDFFSKRGSTGGSVVAVEVIKGPQVEGIIPGLKSQKPRDLYGRPIQSGLPMMGLF